MDNHSVHGDSATIILSVTLLVVSGPPVTASIRQRPACIPMHGGSRSQRRQNQFNLGVSETSRAFGYKKLTLRSVPHVAGKKWVLRSQDNAELRTDRLTSARLGLPAYRNWRAITFGEEAAKTPQPSGSWRQHAPPGRVANQTDFQPQFRQASTPGQIVGSPTLNPKATSFEPEHVRQLREQQEKIESLEILVRNQAKLIGEAAGDIDEMMGELYWASKDIKEVRDSLKTGQMNTAINIKKLDYRAMDLDGIISRQGNWKQALHTNMDEAMKALGLEDEERRPR